MGRDEVGKVGPLHGDWKVLMTSLGNLLRARGSHREFWAEGPVELWIWAEKSTVSNPLGGTPVMFTPHPRMWDNSGGRYQGIPKLITLYYLWHLGRLRPKERSYLPAVKQLPGSAKRTARYTAVVKWLLKSASHKHFPSHCPDCSSADLNGDLWFFSFLITVQAFSRTRFLWSPKWFFSHLISSHQHPL